MNRRVIKARTADSVTSLANRYRVSRDNLAEWNNVGISAVFKVGQQVILYLPPQARALSTRAASKLKDKTISPKSRQAPKKSTKPAPRGKR